MHGEMTELSVISIEFLFVPSADGESLDDEKHYSLNNILFLLLNTAILCEYLSYILRN